MPARRLVESHAPVAGRIHGARAWFATDDARLSLNGTWEFTFHSADPERLLDPELPAPVPTVEGADTIDLPAHWVLDTGGRWGSPIYTNVDYPFPLTPPFPPVDNPTGIHRRTVLVPEEWCEGEGLVLLRFDGVESQARIWVNGEWVGMCTGSRLAHEFDVTGLVRPGVNDVVVKVTQFSSGSYLEDQDQWWLPGVFRDVELRLLRPDTIEDLWVRTDWVDGRGRLRLEVRFPGMGEVGESTTPIGEGGIAEITCVPRPLGATLPGGSGGTRCRSFGGDEGGEEAPVESEGPRVLSCRVPLTWSGKAWVSGWHDLGALEPWTAERPRLHDVTVRVRVAGRCGERRVRTGFRRVEVADGVLLANGKPLRINGVNRHEIRADGGRVFDEDVARADLRLMKEFGVNAIRTSHYPPHPRLLDLADEIGLWVMLEGDIETHGFEGDGSWEGNPSADGRWLGAYLDRTERAFERDKNHPSIFMWSLGNESGDGENLRACAAWLKERTQGEALVHYEADRQFAYTDVHSRMYPTPEEVAAVLDGSDPTAPIAVPGHPAAAASPEARARIRQAPYLMCEYLHAMGTGPGGARGYAELMRHPRHAGGFVWEWRDHALWQTCQDGGRRLAYGGDFGEDVHDGNFVCDGLVDALSRPYAGTFAWARVMAPEAPIFSRAGEELALSGEGRRRLPESVGPADVRDSCGVGACVEVDDDGHLCSVGGLPLGPVRVSVFRAPTDNDRGRGPLDHWGLGVGELGAMGEGLNRAGVSHADRWLAARLHLLREQVREVRKTEGGVRVTAHWGAPGRSFGLMVTTVYEEVSVRLKDGETCPGCRVDVDVEPAGRWPERIPRLGVRIDLPGGEWVADWWGERAVAYSDMPGAQPGAMSRAAVDELWDCVVRPQEAGHRPGLRALRLHGGGTEIFVLPLTSLGWSVSRWTERQLAGAAHWEDLPESGGTYLWLDVVQDGVGTRSCGPDVRPEHAASMGPARMSFAVATRGVGLTSQNGNDRCPEEEVMGISSDFGYGKRTD